MVPLSLNPLNSAGQRDTEYYVPLEVSPKFAHSRLKSSSSHALIRDCASGDEETNFMDKVGVILFPCLRPPARGPMISPIRSLFRPAVAINNCTWTSVS